MRRIILFSILLLSTASVTFGQWRLLRSFSYGWPKTRAVSAYVQNGIVVPLPSSGVRAVYFLTAQSAPNIGFVANSVWDSVKNISYPQIWRTTDAGLIWTKVYEDRISMEATVFNFAFEDQNIGYASDWASAASPCLLKTTDGGLTWKTMRIGLPPSSTVSKVFYHLPQRWLFVIASDLSHPLWLSTDHGTTWKAVLTGYETLYGLSFANDTIGYLTGYHHDYVTTNGGLTWSASTITSLGLQPLALPKDTFFYITGYSPLAARSFDEGKTWSPMNLPNIDESTGDIEGSYRRLYVIGRKGVATSTDTGATWMPICGPTNYGPVLHFVQGDTMYTGDFYYGLWMNPTGQDSDIRYPLLGGGFSAPRSCTDTIAWFGFYNGNSCSQVTITSFSFWGSDRFKLLSDTALHHRAMPLSDTLSFQYDPYGVGFDTEFVGVTYSVGADIHVDTFFLIGTRVRPFLYSAIAKAEDSVLTTSCDSSVWTIAITNDCCDTLRLSKVRLIQGTNFYLAPLTQDSLLPGETVHVRVFGSAARDGAYRDTLSFDVYQGVDSRDTVIPLYFRQSNPIALQFDSLAIKIRRQCTSLDTAMMFHSDFCDTVSILGISLQDTTIFQIVHAAFPIKLTSGSAVPIQLHVRADTVGTFSARMIVEMAVRGKPFDTVLHVSIEVSAQNPLIAILPKGAFLDSCALSNLNAKLTNTACDSIIIDGLYVLGSGRLDSTLAYPVSLAADSSIVISIIPTAYARGTYTASIILQLRARNIEYDTTIVVRYAIQSNVRPQALLDPGRVAMPTSSLCGSADTTIRFTNTSCRTIEWSAADWTVPLTDYSLVSLPPLPRSIPSGGMDSVRIHYVPGGAGVRSAQLHLAFQLDGSRLDTVVILSGTVVPAGITVPSFVRLDSIMQCTFSEDTAWVNNVSCDSIELIHVSAQDSGITILYPPAGTWVHSKDSVAIIFRYTPSAPGPFALMIMVSDSSINGQKNIPLSVEGFVRAPGPDFSVSPANFVFEEMLPCTEYDTSFTVINHSLCDSLRITAAYWTTLNPSLVFDSTGLPIVLPPQDSLSIRFSLRLLPHSSLQDTCIIIGDTTIPIPIAVSSGSGASVLDLSERDKALLVPLCTTASTSLYLSNTGCASIRIDSVEIAASRGTSQFGLLGIDRFPLTLEPGAKDSMSVAFDAEANDTIQATIYFWSTATNSFDSVRIMGIGWSNRDSLRFSLLVNQTRQVITKPGSSVVLSIRCEDSVPVGKALRTVSAQLRYDDDLLTPATFTPANGWLLAAQTLSAPGTLDLQLDRRNPNDAIDAGETMGSLSCRVTAGVDSSSEIFLDSIIFNSDDANYARCALEAVNPSDTAWLVLAPYCGSPFIHDALAGTGLIEEFTVERRPESTSPNLLAEFRLTVDAPTILQIFDERGAIIRTPIDANLSAGSYEIPLSKLPEGVAFLRLQAGREARIVKVALVR